MYYRASALNRTSSQYAFWLLKPPWATNPVYIRLMNKTNKAFALTLDFNLVDYNSVWESMAGTLADSVQSDDGIVSAKYMGEACNGWPILAIVFASFDCAKAFTYAYLGYTLDNASDWDVYTDEAVGEVMATGEFVKA